ncbi:DUF2931 family protein [uncultured Marixanthomonas sp.]|uniref:DUF2931 family protein n=1 Tax=uncultured Marixanthomonas sp. TaxID=757245 RepID=UPI0030DC5736|tara:strand:- start:4919 stop:6001 length:1083 start_codon:yes stop_codon:yes gene_type:complete
MVNNRILSIQKAIVFVFAIFLGTTLGICQDNKKQEIHISEITNGKKFEWRPTESAPNQYPIEIHQGIITCQDGSMVEIPSGGRTVHNGWGETGSTYVVGENLKSLPKKLMLSWLSFTESTFYKGDFELPINKIKTLFDNGYVNHLGRQETYSNVVVGMAPGGNVSVWLLGADKSVEVGHYLAHTAEISMEEFNPSGIQNRKKYIAATIDYLPENIKNQLKKEGVNKEIWNTYRKRFSWKFKNKSTPAEIRTKFYNGAHFYFKTNNPEISDYAQLPIPKQIGYKWYDKDKNKFGADIIFDEQEIFQAFEAIFKNPNNKTVNLIIKVGAYNSSVTLSLESENETVELNKAKVNVYKTSDQIK